MPRGVPYGTTRETLVERMKEIQESLAAFDRRQKYVGELKEWVEKRGLSHLDVLAIYRMLKPKREDKPVKSDKPLHKTPLKPSLKTVRRTSGGFYYVNHNTKYNGPASKLKYTSPDGQYAWTGMSRMPDWMKAYIKAGGKLEDRALHPEQANGRASG